MKKFLLILFVLQLELFAGTTGKLTGKVTDSQTGEPLPGANVLINGTNLGSATDVNGNFLILNIPPDTYSIRFSYLGYETTIVEGVKIIVDQTTNLPVKLNPTSIEVGEVVVTAQAPLIQKDLYQYNFCSHQR